MASNVVNKIHGLLTPGQCVLALIDYQPQMSFGIQSHSRLCTLNSAMVLAKAARLFNVPVVLTTVAAKTFSGALLPELQSVFPDQEPIDRTSMNSWEDVNFKNAIEKTGKRTIIIAGWWTEVCTAFPAIQALQEGYEVYVPTDACGDVSIEAHERAVQRMIQAGVVPMTSLQVMFEWQRDWARTETYEGCMEILKAHADYGIGVLYAKSILGAHASEGGATEDIAQEAMAGSRR
jgi:nicotinamidase-related amidase